MTPLYCPNCGEEIFERERVNYCPFCGESLGQRRSTVVVEPEILRQSPSMSIKYQPHSLPRSVLSGLKWLILLNWIPVIGPFVAGYIAGSKTGSPSRGLLSGLIVGAASILLLSTAIAILGGIAGGIIFGERGIPVGVMLSFTISSAFLLVYYASDICTCILGGFVGGMAIARTRFGERQTRLADTHDTTTGHFPAVLPSTLAGLAGILGTLGMPGRSGYNQIEREEGRPKIRTNPVPWWQSREFWLVLVYIIRWILR